MIDAAGNWVPDSPLPLDPFAANAPLPGQAPDPNARPVVQSATDLAAQQAAAYQAPPPLAAAPLPAAAPAPAPVVPVPPPNMSGVTPVHESPTGAVGAGGGGLKIPDIKGELAQQQAASDAIQAAQTGVGTAEAAASDAETLARHQGAEHMALQQEKIQALQAQRDADVQRINEDQQRAYDEAHQTTIPDFWEGSPGRHAAAAISMALGQAGAGLTAFATGANVGNTAKDIIDNQIKQYAVTQKEKIDNLFKYAAAKNQLGEEQKANWASKLNDLQFQLAAMHQSVADHVLEVAAASKGRVNAAQAQVLATTQQQTGQQLEIAARQRSYENNIQKRQLGIQGYNAQTARIAAVAQKEAAQQQKIEVNLNKLIDDNAKQLHKDLYGQGSTNGPIKTLEGVEGLKSQLQAAAADPDPNKLAGTMAATIEQAGKILSGGKTTRNQTALIEHLKTLGDEVRAKAGNITGGSVVGKTYLERVQAMLDSAGGEAAEQAAQVRDRAMKAHLGPGGFAGTAQLPPDANQRLKDRFLNHLNTLTSTATRNGKPLFEEGGAAPSTGQPAPAANVQRKMPDGSIATFDASGKRIQ